MENYIFTSVLNLFLKTVFTCKPNYFIYYFILTQNSRQQFKTVGKKQLYVYCINPLKLYLFNVYAVNFIYYHLPWLSNWNLAFGMFILLQYWYLYMYFWKIYRYILCRMYKYLYAFLHACDSFMHLVLNTITCK